MSSSPYGRRNSRGDSNRSLGNSGSFSPNGSNLSQFPSGAQGPSSRYLPSYGFGSGASNGYGFSPNNKGMHSPGLQPSRRATTAQGRHGHNGPHHVQSVSKGGSLMPSPPPASLNLIISVAGDDLCFSETNMDWTKLNIFRTRLCDRLTQTHTCHMANRCLFSHDIAWPRRTPFLPRATSLTLRYIPVWCPRLAWPPLVGLCDSMGKINWTSNDANWNARKCHQKCTRGDNCPFVHNAEELLYHPELYKTRSCCLANDDSFEHQLSTNSNAVALCPWYFCPFAHDLFELRDLRSSRQAWHLPPQIVDDQFVARTQDFNELELRIIDFVRRAPNGSFDLYASPKSPLSPIWWRSIPSVIRPIVNSSLENLVPSADHRCLKFDDLLYVMVLASFLNLLLYPVENFYVPTLLSLQCAVIQTQIELVGQFDCVTLLDKQQQKLDELDRLQAAAADVSGNVSVYSHRQRQPLLLPYLPLSNDGTLTSGGNSGRHLNGTPSRRSQFPSAMMDMKGKPIDPRIFASQSDTNIYPLADSPTSYGSKSANYNRSPYSGIGGFDALDRSGLGDIGSLVGCGLSSDVPPGLRSSGGHIGNDYDDLNQSHNTPHNGPLGASLLTSFGPTAGAEEGLPSTEDISTLLEFITSPAGLAAAAEWRSSQQKMQQARQSHQPPSERMSPTSAGSHLDLSPANDHAVWATDEDSQTRTGSPAVCVRSPKSIFQEMEFQSAKLIDEVPDVEPVVITAVEAVADILPPAAVESEGTSTEVAV